MYTTFCGHIKVFVLLTSSEIAMSEILHVICMLMFIRKCQIVLQNGFTLYLTKQGMGIAFAALPCQYLVWFLVIPSRFIVVSLCDFNVHFLDERWYWAPFHMCTDHARIFLVKCLFSFFAHFNLGISVFLLLIYRSPPFSLWSQKCLYPNIYLYGRTSQVCFHITCLVFRV